ncbi:MAG: cytochrome c biogenesis protein CcsA [Natronohydrobacter sp.]|nr:cytochrome c biogenesis protein CcsA [Natronohydrobacter sp.]
MWTFLYQLASPKYFYQKTGNYLPWLGFLAAVFLLGGMFWGLFFAPADYQQGDAFRIIYVHVPAAFMSMAIYASMGFLSILLLVWRIKLAGLMLPILSVVGASMAFLALVTGSIWGKPMWGTWWVWDARLTSELILLFLYSAMIILKNSLPDSERSERLLAILCLVGLVDLPIIHYSVYWWNSLHQGATLTVFSKPKIALEMLYPLLLTLLGFSLYCAFIAIARARLSLLYRERQQRWVRELFTGEKHDAVV